MPVSSVPDIQPAEYALRLSRLRERMRQLGLDAVVAYSDEYHFENGAYLCGYHPRFEMALLVVGSVNQPTLITGLEGEALAEVTAIGCWLATYAPFSAQGMAHQRGGDLVALLKRSGLEQDMQLGVVGPRYFLETDIDNAKCQHAVPAFIIDALVQTVGESDHITNATALLTHLSTGLRAVKSAIEIALLEEAGTRASRGVQAMFRVARPGMTERELLGAAQAEVPSALFSYPPVVHSGIERCNTGLESPSDKRIELGEPVVIYYSPSVSGYSGNSGRSAAMAESPQRLPPSFRRVVEALYGPAYESYLAIVRELSLNVRGADLVAIGRSILTTSGLRSAYEPIHATGLTEWENTYDEAAVVQSGHVVQVDLTAFSDDCPFGPAKIEDGFAVADEALQADLQRAAPMAWERIERRREALARRGLVLDSSVLPLSDIAGEFAPFTLNWQFHLSPSSGT